MPKSKKETPAPRKKYPFWFYIVLIIIPVIFFIILEGALRLFGYGKDTSQWIEATEQKFILNPDLAYKYFSNVQKVPTSIEDVFDQHKKENAFRVFVLGGSSAAGYPFMPMGSFSRYIRKRLELAYPNSTIEVVNVSLTAVNSYTIRDLIPGILEKDPDLILIYAGHNEFYGALGVGSMESLGQSRELINLLLYLKKYKTVELLTDAMTFVVGLFSVADESRRTGTLMARMAKEQYIPYQSDVYKLGLYQFEGNMREIIQMIKEKNVPLILGTLTSNLKDQPPFISIKTENYPAASSVFNNAAAELRRGDKKSALGNFVLAKDLDALRFRAPEDINIILRKLSSEFNAPVVDISNELNYLSPDSITGNNLMTDHLHPTLEGYQLIGKIFFDEMERKNFLPKTALVVPIERQDSITKANYMFTDLDSSIAEYRIQFLKNDWPFVDKRKSLPPAKLFSPKNFIDSLASEVVRDKITWVEAHREAASKYLAENDMKSFQKHMDILIYQYPIIVEYYDYVANEFLKKENFEIAYKYCVRRDNIKPGAFSSKWIGIIELSRKNSDKAIKYLSHSLELKADDAQVLYNLAGAYVMKKDYKTALSYINKALTIDSGYRQAKELKNQLEDALK